MGELKSSFRLESDIFADTFTVGSDGLPEFKAYLPGEWVEGERGKIDDRTPIDESVFARVNVLSERQALKGLETLYAKGRWEARNTPGERRLIILEKAAELLARYIDELTEALVYDAGKTYEMARGEVKASIDRLEKAMLDLRRFSGDYIPGDWDSHTIETEGLIRREPYGVVACIMPFNYPLYDTVMKVVASFIAGNAVVLKPSLLDPIPPILFTRILLEAGLPRNAIMLALMDGPDFGRILPDRRIGAVLLTGSSETGRRVLATAGIKSYLLELGGGDPAIVLRDADLNEAAENIVKGIISYSGQRCDAIKIVLAERPIYDELKRLLIEELKKQARVGDPRDKNNTVGPLIARKPVDEMEYAIKDAIEKGGKVLYGGRRLGPTYIEPTLIEISRDRVKELYAFQKEVFAPLALLVEVESLDEAIDIANSRPYGLDAAIFSKNIEWIRRAARYLEVGAVYVNMFPRHGIGYYPYGGRKDSGIGVEGIGYSIEHVSAYKSIIFNYKGARVWEYTI